MNKSQQIQSLNAEKQRVEMLLNYQTMPPGKARTAFLSENKHELRKAAKEHDQKGGTRHG